MYQLIVHINDEGCQIDWQVSAELQQHSVSWRWKPGDDAARAVGLRPAGVDLRAAMNGAQAVAGVVIDRDYLAEPGTGGNAGRYQQTIRVTSAGATINASTQCQGRGQGKGAAHDGPLPGPPAYAPCNDMNDSEDEAVAQMRMGMQGASR